MLVIAGFFTGLLVGLIGVVGAVLMAYLYPLRLMPSKLVATDIVHAVPLVLFAGLNHMFVGHVDFELLVWLLLGSVPGVWVGAKLSARMPQHYLRAGLAFLLAAIGLKLTGLFT